MDNLKEQFETMMNSFREIYGDSFKFKDGPGTLNLKKLIVCLQLSIGDVDNIENITTVMKLELCQLSAFHKLVSLVEFSRFDPKSFTQQERYLLFEMGIEFQKLERARFAQQATAPAVERAIAPVAQQIAPAAQQAIAPAPATLLDLENKAFQVSGFMSHKKVEELISCSFEYVEKYTGGKWKKIKLEDGVYEFANGIRYRVCPGKL